MNTFRTIWARLQRGSAYRKAFVAEQCKRLVPFQIHALRKARKISQAELARLAGLTQGVVSRAEDPNYGNLTFNTVIRIANGFGVAFVAKFVPFSELDDWYVSTSEKSLADIPSFEAENASAEQMFAVRESVAVHLTACAPVPREEKVINIELAVRGMLDKYQQPLNVQAPKPSILGALGRKELYATFGNSVG